jgi:hypothetical protein
LSDLKREGKEASADWGKKEVELLANFHRRHGEKRPAFQSMKGILPACYHTEPYNTAVGEMAGRSQKISLIVVVYLSALHEEVDSPVRAASTFSP